MIFKFASHCVSKISPRCRTLFLSNHFASKSKSSKRYSDTLNLPRTSFPLSMKNGLAAKREIEIQKACEFDSLYQWQASSADRDQKFILHDGPPYANGNLHVGHLFNKVLKDITNRYKLLRGYKINYRPGWDCHGMPIEQKALAKLNTDIHSMSPLTIRDIARKFAEETIEHQKSGFQRWGIMADWSNCYHTFDKEYETKQLEVFYQMYEKGYIYQDFMPVFWSPSSKSALAEAELEYNPEHQSTAVFVKFPLVNLDEILRRYFDDDIGIYAVIWTTTPWTLPANQTVAYHPNMSYSLVEDPRNDDIYLLATSAVEKFSDLLQVKLKILSNLEGGCLSGLEYRHPVTQEELPMLPGYHVTEDKGTGLVHSAPAHGHEDFQLATHHDITVKCMVDEEGNYTEEAGPQLAGLHVLTSGTDAVLNMLQHCILHKEAYTHSYPYDWRTKQAVIIRASKQWFVNTSKLRDGALEALGSVKRYPEKSGGDMTSQLDHRTYWCISRQRVWGVPIPVFYHTDTGKPLINRQTLDHFKQLVEEYGTDCWWKLSLDKLLPEDIIKQSGYNGDEQFTRGDDVLDIWFDSGSSWFTVLDGQMSDVYLEGLDQFGGWFQSSLLTSVALQQHSPYRSLVVHGFTVDEEGKKMSKSLGNVVDPNSVIDGDEGSSSPHYGADVLRWWVARSGFHPTVEIGPSILDQSNAQVYEMRKTMRYLVGNLSDFDPDSQMVPYEDMLPQDKHMLHLLYALHDKITKCYDDFKYSKALLRLEKFLNTHASTYLHYSKDRLYCNHADDVSRRSGQTVQWYLLQGIMSYLAPVLPHLVEELYQHLPHTEEEVFFHTRWFDSQPSWNKPDLAVTFDLISHIKSTFMSNIEGGQHEEIEVTICSHGNTHQYLMNIHNSDTSIESVMTECLGCSSSKIVQQLDGENHHGKILNGNYSYQQEDESELVLKYSLLLTPTTKHKCERCRRQTSPSAATLCERCENVLSEGWDT